MWRMQTGDRVLTNSEWELYAFGLDILLDHVLEDLKNSEDREMTRVAVFDHLTAEQKVVVLAETARAIRDESVPDPRLTAVSEGVVGAVMATLENELQLELELAGDPKYETTEVRRLVRGALAAHVDSIGTLPDESCDDPDEWNGIIDEFADLILWDRDFELDDLVLDLPPDQAQVVRASLTIPEDYFLETQPEPTDEQLQIALETLGELLNRPVPDEDGAYLGLLDWYNDLTVGPCRPEWIRQWEAHPWVQVASIYGGGWDGRFKAWEAAVSAELPSTLFTPSHEESDLLEWPEGVTAKPYGAWWIVQQADGSIWSDVLADEWVDDPQDDEVVTFATEFEARAAFLAANRFYSERAARHDVVGQRVASLK